MGRSGGGSASLGPEANDGDTPSGSLLVLDGELAGSGPDIAVLIRLTAPHSTAPVWSDRFVVRTNELFSAEDVIAERAGSRYRDHHVAYTSPATLDRGDGQALRWLHTAADTGLPCVTWFERIRCSNRSGGARSQELQGYVRARRESSRPSRTVNRT